MGVIMKVIKKGKVKSNLTNKKIACSECSCKFKLESEKEAKLVSDRRDGDYYEITCPECGNKGTYAASLFQNSTVE
jgi:RNase P subunit RPR2